MNDYFDLGIGDWNSITWSNYYYVSGDGTLSSSYYSSSSNFDVYINGIFDSSMTWSKLLEVSSNDGGIILRLIDFYILISGAAIFGVELFRFKFIGFCIYLLPCFKFWPGFMP